MDLDKIGGEPQQSERESENGSVLRELAETCNRPVKDTAPSDGQWLYRTQQGLARDVADAQHRQRLQLVRKRSRWQGLVLGLALLPIVIMVTVFLYGLVFGRSWW